MRTFKLLNLVAASLLFFACSKENKAHSSIKEYIKTHANDPSSYDPIDFSDVDTVTLDYDKTEQGILDKGAEIAEEGYQLQRQLDHNYTAVNMAKRRDSIGNIHIAHLKAYLLHPTKLYKITHSFRAKNAMGALVLQKMVFFFSTTWVLQDAAKTD